MAGINADDLVVRFMDSARDHYRRWNLDYTGVSWYDDWGSNLHMSPAKRVHNVVDAIGVSAANLNPAWGVWLDNASADDEANNRPARLVICRGRRSTNLSICELQVTMTLLRLSGSGGETVVALRHGGEAISWPIAVRVATFLAAQPYGAAGAYTTPELGDAPVGATVET